MASRTKACRDCHKGTDRPSQVCYHCAGVRENKERARQAKVQRERDEAASEADDSELLA